MICTICNDTGKLPGSDCLDCGHCGAATERTELNEAVGAFAIMNRDDMDCDWFVHQRARQIEREAQAARIAELERSLRSAHHLLANVEGLSKNNIENLAGEEADAIAAVLGTATSAPAVEQQPVAFVPIHPRNGPLWASTIPSLDRDHPTNYELRPIYFAAPQAADTEKVREAIPEGWQVTHMPPWDALTDAAQAAQRISVQRLVAPFCDAAGTGVWCGPTLEDAMQTAHTALKLPYPVAPQAPVREVPGWISVDERLPSSDPDSTVWATWNGAGFMALGQKQGEARYIESLGWQPVGCRGWDWNVSHWQPLPALPAAPVQQEGASNG